MKKIDLKERMESKTLKTDSCHIWTAYTDERGYGRLMINRKNCYAHRVAYELHKGEIGDKEVCHTCDNPPCVNPAHLFLGTHKENIQDMFNKNRGNRLFASSHPNTRLSVPDVLDIRSSNLSVLELAKKYNIQPPGWGRRVLDARFFVGIRFMWIHPARYYCSMES